MQELPKSDGLPPNVTKLTLENSCLEEDPLEVLKYLPKLKILKLGRDSYRGEKMMCSGGADTFPQLQVLSISYLYNLKELSVEGGEMPILKEFHVRGCARLRRYPTDSQALWYLTHKRSVSQLFLSLFFLIFIIF